MKIYLVGGAVRDQLLGYPVIENDWVVVGSTPEEMIKNNFKPVGKDFPVFLHPETHEEYALARTERKIKPGYTGFVFHASEMVTLEEDLKRRDLTINAMAQDQKGTIIDPYGGLQDLQQRILRHVSPAFVEDPVRILRVARFAARYKKLGFTIAPETMTFMQEMVHNGEVNALVPERVWQEFIKALAEPDPMEFFYVLHQCGALTILFPWFAPQLSQLKIIANQDLLLRFASLLVRLNKAQIEQLCTRYLVPRDYRDFANIANQQQHTFNQKHLSAEEILRLLNQTDAWRRKSRFNKLLELFSTSPHCKTIKAAFFAAQHINVSELQAQGLSGEALGKSITEQRLKIIKQCLNKSE